MHGQAIEELLARSAVYHGLSVVLRHPSTETATWLTSREHRRLIDVIEIMGKEKKDVRSLFEAVRRLVTALDAVSIAEWARDYERIFGYAVQSAAPPYELEYGEAHSHRQPHELGDIAAFYQAFGLRVAKESHERVDHVATECDFLQYLLYKQACALDADDAEHAQLCETAARQFLLDHLGRWGVAFALRLSREAGNGIFGAIARLLQAWLLEECARLQVTAGSGELPLRLGKETEEIACASCVAVQGQPDGRVDPG